MNYGIQYLEAFLKDCLNTVTAVQANRLKMGSRRERETSIGEVQSEDWAEGGGEPDAGECDSIRSEQKEPLRDEYTEERRPALPPHTPHYRRRRPTC